MAQGSDHLAGFDTENTGGFLSGLLADEDHFDRRALWRLGSWGVATVGAVIVAVLAGQSSIGLHREQMASGDLARQQQIQSVAKESQNEARRLASAIETLNSDRDRLYARVTVLEQGLDSVTGAIARQKPPRSRRRHPSRPSSRRRKIRPLLRSCLRLRLRQRSKPKSRRRTQRLRRIQVRPRSRRLPRPPKLKPHKHRARKILPKILPRRRRPHR